MELKQAGVLDAPAISLIHAASWRVAYRGLLPQDYLNSIADTRWVEPFERLLRDDSMQAQIAYDGETPVGCVSYGARSMEGAPPPPSGWGYVLTLYVHPAHVRKGHGTALLRTAENGLRQQGYTHCYLYVLDTNVNARLFYERSGYAWDGTGIDCPIGPVTVRDLRYIKKL